MNTPILSVREMQANDVELIVDYWHNADETYLKAMGADKQKVPGRHDLANMLKAQLSLPYPQKNSFCLLWLLNGQPIGHNNTNPTLFGKQATMHLHIWQTANRQKGLGLSFMQMAIPIFFNKLQLQQLVCEPYALNASPNNLLPKAGFQLIKQYVTTPGSMNFEQTVNRWEMTADECRQLYPL